MRNIELSEYVDADLTVSGRHFGGNALYTRNTDDGVPSPDFVDAIENLDIQYIRYPAGQPDVAYADGVIVDGYLPDHLVNFLESARSNNFQVLIVTPTHESYPGAEDIGEFARLIAQDFADVVHAFEVGNEYWNHQTETSYGQVANESVLEIADALNDVGVDRPIWIQMGDAGGWESEFHTRNDERGWLTRTIESNNTIIDQISDSAFREIDGVVEHFYLRGGEQYIDIEFPNDQMIGLDFAIWQNYLNEGATLNITEWNIRSSNLDQLGMRAASSLVAHFSHIIELGADEAYLWPPHLNTSSDLAGSGEVLVDSQTGIVINSVGGAIFDMMSTSLPGLEYLPSGAHGSNSEVLHHLYGSDDRVVVYLSSRSEEVEAVSYSLGGFFDGFVLTSALRVGYDHSSSDGRHYNYRTRSWDQSEVITVLGEDYVINEHDVRASIDVLDHGSAHSFGSFVFELLPYQVVQLVYEFPTYNTLHGTVDDDALYGGDTDDLVYLYEGDDTVTAGSGADTVYGGLGDDYINSGSDGDLVDGGDGNDSLRGWGGDDTLLGGDGDDDIQGSFGRDSLVGGSGNDSLFGGDWHDTLAGGDGDDLLWGGNGNDLLIVGRGQDSINGGSGRDTLSFGNASEGVNVWTTERIVEVGLDRVEFSHIEAIEGTDFRDRFMITTDGMQFFGLDGDDHFNFFSGTQNSVYAGDGDDTLFIFGGVDNIIFGGTGDDRILSRGDGNNFFGGEGDDEIRFFNQASDTINYQIGDGNDVISGFDVGEDLIRLDRGLEFQMSILVQENSTFIRFDDGGSIEMVGVSDFNINRDLEFF
ncbi:calcium-binding protein [uncultured Tateyamaria sp.]|uniref:calcium-binding protein n=1 Tax=uncultured Tateyamaria sp. TaxID=455651 RepID=UPI00262C9477|nr:calcium-binding protein [uncultured Tateyamaria sp.]